MLVSIGLVNVIARIGAAQKKAAAQRPVIGPVVDPPRRPTVATTQPWTVIRQQSTTAPEAPRRAGETLADAFRELERQFEAMERRYESGWSGTSRPTSRAEPAPRPKVVAASSSAASPAGASGSTHAVAGKGTHPSPKSPPPAAALVQALAKPASFHAEPSARSRAKARRKAWNGRRMRDGLIAAMVLASPPSASR